MNKRMLTILSTGALAFAACSGHGGNGAVPATQQPGAYAPASFSWGKQILNGATYVGPANVGHMQVFVQVRQQNTQALIQYAQQVSDPTSPVYRQYLTPDQIAQRFGATQQDYQTAADYFVRNGLTVAGWPQHLALSVAGPQTAMEHAFHTKFAVYQRDGIEFVAPRSTPSFAAVIPVTQVANLVTFHPLHRNVVPAPPRANSNDTLGYSPQQVRGGFDYSGAYSAGFTGTGITVGIIGTGPVNIPRTGQPDPCGDRDAQALVSLYGVSNAAQICERDVTPTGVSAGLKDSGIPTAAPGSPPPDATPSPNPGQQPWTMFPYSGSFQTPPPVSEAPCNGALPGCNPEDLEAQLDTQQVATLAPGATVKFYLAYNANDCLVYFPQTCNPQSSPSGPNPGSPEIGIVEADAEIQQVIADNQADVVSISYGGGEPQFVDFYFGSGTDPAGYEPAEFAAMAAEGIAVFVSSGDSGVAECSSGSSFDRTQRCVSYPSGDKNVTSVGGVNAPIDEFGQRSGNITAWGVTNGGLDNTGGSGGGISTIFTAPSWQATALGATWREQPDVSLDADTLTGVTVFTNGTGGCTGIGPCAVGGTSVAAPEMAAMWALVLDACKKNAACTAGGGANVHPWRLGNAAPYFYSIYKGQNLVGSRAPGGFPFLPYAGVFYDVVYGSNTMPGKTVGAPLPGYPAGPGYDGSTGVGVPFAGHLIQGVTGSAAP